MSTYEKTKEELFESQTATTKQMVNEYNDTLTILIDQVKALFIIAPPTVSTLNSLYEGLNELKKGDFKALFKYIDSIKESYMIENELYRKINENEED